MYIVQKRHQNSQLFGPDSAQELSILAVGSMLNQRGLRKSSSLTNGMGPGRNKTALGEYGKEGPRSPV